MLYRTYLTLQPNNQSQSDRHTPRTLLTQTTFFYRSFLDLPTSISPFQILFIATPPTPGVPGWSTCSAVQQGSFTVLYLYLPISGRYLSRTGTKHSLGPILSRVESSRICCTSYSPLSPFSPSSCSRSSNCAVPFFEIFPHRKVSHLFQATSRRPVPTTSVVRAWVLRGCCVRTVP